jgi:CheY-like chemotaxis protein
MIENIHGVESVPAPVKSAEVEPRPCTILLVEDDRSLRRYLEVVLRREGYDVVTAVDGLEAMKATLTSEIDLVVTDAIMPNLNGHELVRFLRNTPQLSQLPIVLLSALEVKEAKSGQHQPDVCLAKPIAPKVLTDCLAELLKNREVGKAYPQITPITQKELG